MLAAGTLITVAAVVFDTGVSGVSRNSATYALFVGWIALVITMAEGARTACLAEGWRRIAWLVWAVSLALNAITNTYVSLGLLNAVIASPGWILLSAYVLSFVRTNGGLRLTAGGGASPSALRDLEQQHQRALLRLGIPD